MISEALVLYNDKLICAAMDMNVIYEVDLKRKKGAIIGSIPEETIFSKRTVGAVSSYKNKIIFAPFNGKNIWFYDVETKQWSYLKLHLSSCKTKFWNSCVYKNYLFLLPVRYPALVRVNLDTNSIDEIKDCIFPGKIKEPQYGYFFSDYVVDNEYLIAASCASNHVLRFNMENCNYEWIEIGDKNNRYVGLTRVGNDFWLAPRRNTPIVKWAYDGTVKELELPAMYKDKYNFLGIRYENNIILPGISEGMTITINPQNERINVDEDSMGFAFSARMSTSVQVECLYDGSIVIRDETGKSCLKNVIVKEEFDEYIADYNKNNEHVLEKEILKESAIFDLQTYINLMGRN